MSHDGTLPGARTQPIYGSLLAPLHDALSVGAPHRAVGDPVNPRAAGRDANVYTRCLRRG